MLIRKNRHIILGLLFIFMECCASVKDINQTMMQFRGMNESELVRRFGKANNE